MRIGDTKYYHVKQVKENGKVVGNLCMLGRTYGYIVELHYYSKAGYPIHQVFDTERKAERFYNETLKRLEA